MLANKQQIIKFILLAFSIYILWFIIYDFVIEPDKRIDFGLNVLLANSGSFLLRLLGYTADVSINGNKISMRINSTSLLDVGNACNGLELFVLFVGFIICFPSGKANKWWFIIAGILSIHLLNSIRAAALALNQYYHPQSLHFNHHYTFTIIVYAYIFYLWILWVNRFSKSKSMQKTTFPPHAKT